MRGGEYTVLKRGSKATYQYALERENGLTLDSGKQTKEKGRECVHLYGLTLGLSLVEQRGTDLRCLDVDAMNGPTGLEV